MVEKKRLFSMEQKAMVTITAVQLENLLRHDTNALQQVQALRESGLVKTCGVAKEDILRLARRAEKESIDEEITAVHGPVVNLHLASACSRARKVEQS